MPIIFLTAADSDAQLALRGYAVGAIDWLTKPFDPWVLRAKVSVFVELWSKTRQLELAAGAASELRALTQRVEDAVAVLEEGDSAAALTLLRHYRGAGSALG